MKASEEVKARGWRRRAWYWLAAPIPRRWSSAFTLAIGAVVLTMLAPRVENRFSSIFHNFPVAFAGGEVYPFASSGPTGAADEVWQVRVDCEYRLRLGRERYLLRSQAQRIAPGSATALPPPKRQEVQAVLTRCAGDWRWSGLPEPWLGMAKRGEAELVRWSWRGFLAEVMGWLARLLFIAAILLGVMRMEYRRRFERAIARWYEGKCPRCGYDLKGLNKRPGLCPECGTDGAAHVRFVDGILRAR